MTGLELLELAAKAAGIEYDAEVSKPHPVSKAFWGLWLVIHGEPSEHQRRNWNPLTDDGDALRLAVKLNLLVECMVGQSAARTFDSKFGGCVDHSATRQYQKRDFHPDPFAATRRAIVCAAAEIGAKLVTKPDSKTDWSAA